MDDLEKVLKHALAAEANRSRGVVTESRDAVLKHARVGRVLAASAFFVAAAVAIVAVSFGGAHLARFGAPGQQVPGDPGSAQPASPTSSGSGVGSCRTIPTGGSAEWSRNQTAGDALEALAAELQQETGVTPGSPDGLSKGLIGIAVDNTTQTVFVVVDPTVFPVTGLQARLQGIVDRSFPSTEEAFPVRIASSCNPAGDLLGAQDVLEATMHASGDTAPASGLIGFSLDPYTSTWRVTLFKGAPGATATANSLEGDLGSLVTEEWSDEITHTLPLLPTPSSSSTSG